MLFLYTLLPLFDILVAFVAMDPFGYEMAVDARNGAGLPNIRVPDERPDERYQLRLVRERYARRGGVIGDGFNGPELQRVLDEVFWEEERDEVPTPRYEIPATVRRGGRKRSRKQKAPKKVE